MCQQCRDRIKSSSLDGQGQLSPLARRCCVVLSSWYNIEDAHNSDFFPLKTCLSGSTHINTLGSGGVKYMGICFPLLRKENTETETIFLFLQQSGHSRGLGSALVWTCSFSFSFAS